MRAIISNAQENVVRTSSKTISTLSSTSIEKATATADLESHLHDADWDSIVSHVLSKLSISCVSSSSMNPRYESNPLASNFQQQGTESDFSNIDMNDRGRVPSYAMHSVKGNITSSNASKAKSRKPHRLSNTASNSVNRFFGSRSKSSKQLLQENSVPDTSSSVNFFERRLCRFIVIVLLQDFDIIENDGTPLVGADAHCLNKTETISSDMLTRVVGLWPIFVAACSQCSKTDPVHGVIRLKSQVKLFSVMYVTIFDLHYYFRMN